MQAQPRAYGTVTINKDTRENIHFSSQKKEKIFTIINDVNEMQRVDKMRKLVHKNVQTKQRDLATTNADK